jgi:hypothetical protein
VVEPRREHSRKPDCVRERIEKLVDGPYLELPSQRNPSIGSTRQGAGNLRLSGRTAPGVGLSVADFQ